MLTFVCNRFGGVLGPIKGRLFMLSTIFGSCTFREGFQQESQRWDDPALVIISVCITNIACGFIGCIMLLARRLEL